MTTAITHPRLSLVKPRNFWSRLKNVGKPSNEVKIVLIVLKWSLWLRIRLKQRRKSVENVTKRGSLTSNSSTSLPVWNWALSPRTESDCAERRLLLTSETEIGVRGVNVLPTKNKTTKDANKISKTNVRSLNQMLSREELKKQTSQLKNEQN